MQANGKQAEAFDLTRSYVQLDDGPAARQLAVDAGFWQRLGEREALQHGRLVMIGRGDSDWQHWEMRPDGDELVCLLSGAVDMVLETDDGERVVALRDRGAVIVPQDAWHRAVVHATGELLFVTRSAGTRLRPV